MNESDWDLEAAEISVLMIILYSHLVTSESQDIARWIIYNASL